MRARGRRARADGRRARGPESAAQPRPRRPGGRRGAGRRRGRPPAARPGGGHPPARRERGGARQPRQRQGRLARPRAARLRPHAGPGDADAPRSAARSTAADLRRPVKELRQRTGAGMMDCKNALTEAGGDMDKAVELLRVKMGSKIGKLAGREAAEGTVQSYIHANGKVGVLVEVDCNTDFVARNDDFVAFASDVALHVAAVAERPLGQRGRRARGGQARRAAHLRAAGRGRGQAGEHPHADRRGQAQQVARGGRAPQAGPRQRRQARQQDDRAAARRPVGQDRRERRRPALHALRRR